MGRLIDADELENCKGIMNTIHGEIKYAIRMDDIRNAPTVEAIPKEEVRQFIENIQKIKDNHNEYGEPINYGTICGILIEGYRLLDKYREDKDGKND